MSNDLTIDESIDLLYNDINLDSSNANAFNAALYLGKSGDSRAFAPLIAALERGGAYMRSSAALALGLLGNKEAIPYLVETFVRDPGIYVRCDAALALGELAQEDIFPVFLRRFIEDDFEIQKRIIIAVAKLKGHNTNALLQQLKELINDMNCPSTQKDFLRFLIDERLTKT